MSAENHTVEAVGKYELHDQIALGGMARVFLGRLVGAAGFTKCVAIKRIHEHLATDEELVALLLEEARITQHIRHPNVVSTLDVEATDNELLLVMEYVHGPSLSEILKACVKTKTQVPITIAASIVHGVLLGLHAAHETTDPSGTPLSIIHRDVSPQNVLVGADGIARLLDFGIAKAVGSIAHTRTGELRGKLPYMAPELLRFETATRQSDVWAAAVMLWEVMCLRRLFTGEEMELWGLILTSDLRTPGQVLGHPNPLDAVVMRGLTRDRAQRFATAAEMAEAIQRAIPIAPAAEVAAWVASISTPSLAKREESLRLLGARTPSVRGQGAVLSLTPPRPTSPGVASDADPPRSRSARRRAWMPWSITAMLAAVIIVLVAWRAPRPDRSAPRLEPAATAATPSIRPSAEPPPPPPEVQPPPPTSVSPSPSADSSAAPKLAKKGHAPPRSTPSASAKGPESPRSAGTCDPPFSVDEGGRKIYKLECVKGN